ncbi:hypothetical protein S40285_07904 [Stachybotrys chlorohalonatus IBT 40285]|uniref:Uncharacterized protein n=1 Tax=Stachybotrys chlorohalonatus (strain IBT 40285) TaxID=1283841 RepID=A0A084QDG0_STAC4|nr:hypothetical protein S40285_07904 [Stachybotrys chlorohalonata IBT 40285]
MKNSKKSGSSSAGRISDARFSSFETDPRFRLPSRRQTKTTLDKRFSRMLTDDEFTTAAKVDRYGRKISSDKKKKALQRLYQAEDEEKEDESGENRNGDAQDDDEIDDDELVQRELRAAEDKYDPARGGGFSSSDEDSESDPETEDDEDGGAGIVTKGVIQKLQDEQNDVQTGEVSKRIAVVNLDWDHIRSTDLMALFSSFVPSGGGHIVNISIYPSEFGKERMKQEELEGPPKELFKNEARNDSDESDDDDGEDGDEKIKKQLMQEGDDQDFDSDALRAYQVDRLRYFYAIVVCSDIKTSQAIYEATDGTEYQSSSNFLDLRFVPDDLTFDDEPRDQCEKLPDSYKPIEFVTNALQSSKVKLTWDLHPEEVARKESINRAFSGSRADIEENDLKAYLASDSEDEQEEQEVVDAAEAEEEQPKLSKKELARKKMREALGLTDESASKGSKDGAVGDMQITFAPALSDNKAKANGEAEETTIEKYKRKERERKEKKRQKAKAKREGVDIEEEEDNVQDVQTVGADDDLGFDDPFFTTEDPAPNSKTSVRKEERRKKREAREAAEAESAAAKAHLTKVMAEDADENQAEHLDHFNMNEIIRAEKQKRKKGKGKKGKKQGDEAREGLQEGFKMDLEDDRFKAVFENHEFAIDPSNPRFKATEGMKELLEEGRKKRRMGDEGDGERSKKVKKGRR